MGIRRLRERWTTRRRKSDPESLGKQTAPRSVLAASPPFRRLLLAQIVSFYGDRLVPVALAFAILDAHRSATLVGVTLAALSLSFVATVLFGGVFADRFQRRRIMVVADVARAICQGGSAMMFITGSLSVPALLLLQVGCGVARAFFEPAAVALLPTIVPDELLQEANALVGIQRDLSSIIGPATAGILIATTGAGWGLLLDAATFVFSAVTVLSIAVPRELRHSSERFFLEMRQGWQYFLSQRWLWSSVGYFSLFVGGVLAPLMVLGPVASSDGLGGPLGWSLILAGQGAGGLLGGLYARRIDPRRPLVVGFFVLGVTWVIFLILLTVVREPVPVAVAAAAAGGGLSLFASLWATTLQRNVEPELLGRVSAYDWLGTSAIEPIGLAFAAPLAAAVGVWTLFGAYACWVGISTLVLLSLRAIWSLERHRGGDPVSEISKSQPTANPS